MKRPLLLMVMVILLAAACKKDIPPETIAAPTVHEVGEYFPIHEGSWWNYETDSGEIRSITATGPKLGICGENNVIAPSYVASEHKTDTLLMLNDYRLCGNGRQLDPNVDVGEVLYSDHDCRFVCFSTIRKIIASDTTVYIGSTQYTNVVIVEEHFYSGDELDYYYYWRYYARGGWIDHDG